MPDTLDSRDLPGTAPEDNPTDAKAESEEDETVGETRPTATDPDDARPDEDEVDDGGSEDEADSEDEKDSPLEPDTDGDESVDALIDPTEATAAGGTAKADAVLGADAVDEELGDDAPERAERDTDAGSESRLSGGTRHARRQRLLQLLVTARAIYRAYGRPSLAHPAQEQAGDVELGDDAVADETLADATDEELDAEVEGILEDMGFDEDAEDFCPECGAQLWDASDDEPVDYELTDEGEDALDEDEPSTLWPVDDEDEL